jgi:superfamily II DNA or RNA helicase
VITLRYEKGTIAITSTFKLPHTVWDPRSGDYRCLGMFYNDVREYLNLSKLEYKDSVLDLLPVPKITCSVTLRDYQKAALDAWLGTKNGVLVLPTGAGKTVIGMKAISVLNVPTLVVVPTLELVKQWKKELESTCGIEVGSYSSEGHLLKPITVGTYDTAYLRAEELGNKFLLLLFDEVHHLPSPGYANIAELFVAPYRLGLTATYEREDGLHKELERLIGGKVYEIGIDELKGTHLAEYTTKKIVTDLTEDERAEYEKYHALFTDFLKERHITLRSPKDFRLLVMRSGRDPMAREALLARNRARHIALNSHSKLNVLSEILDTHFDERMIIFTEHNLLVHAISREFLIPAITHTTQKEERAEILDNFRTGRYRVIVTSKVLEEGIDVPEASVGVILSGSGSKREYKQRLGRILRKREGKLAILYEIVSKGTTEINIARRRKHATE